MLLLHDHSPPSKNAEKMYFDPVLCDYCGGRIQHSVSINGRANEVIRDILKCTKCGFVWEIVKSDGTFFRVPRGRETTC